MNKIDYSQYSTWMMCPWLWCEKYVHGMSRRYIGQREDPLALGSLVHNGLDNFSRTGRYFLSPEVMGEVNPTPECVMLAEVLVQGFLRKFSSERWEMEMPEEAVEFPLEPGVSVFHKDDWTGVAKLDRYFYVPSDTQIESGLPGQTLTLGRGWWSQEFKTKSHGI